MNLYAVVENYWRPDDKVRKGDGYCNQLLALYTSRRAALNHMNDGVPSERFRLKATVMESDRDGELLPVSYYESINSNEDRHEEVVRHMVKVTAEPDDYEIMPYTSFILYDDDASMADYI